MSKSDRQRGVHLLRDDRLSNRRPKDRLPKRKALTEQILADIQRDQDAKEFSAECVDSLADFNEYLYEHEEPLAEWEWELLRTPSTVGTYQDYVDRHAARRPSPYRDQQPLAEWEREALHGDERTVWSSDSDDEAIAVARREMDEERRREEEARYDEEYGYGDDEDSWLPCMSMTQTYQLFGEGFLIEGPTQSRRREGHSRYYRVYDLAREVGVNSNDLVWFLRVEGEYVRSHMSMVSEAVWIDVLGISMDLQTILGKRTTKPTAAQEFAAWDANIRNNLARENA